MRLVRLSSLMAAWLLLTVVASSIPSLMAALADEPAWARYMELGETADQQGRYASAEYWFLTAVREAERLDAKGPLLARSLKRLAEVYRKEGQQTQAEAVTRRAMAVEGQSPDTTTAELNVFTSLDNYAAFLRGIGREHDAAMVQMRSQRFRQVRAGGSNSKLLYFNPVGDLRDYAVLLRQRNRGPEARAMETLASAEAQRLVEHYQKLRESGSFEFSEPSLVWPLQMTAGLEALEGRLYPEAQDLFNAAAKNAERLGPDDVRLATSFSFLALACAAQGKDDDVDRIAQQALTILEKAAGSNHALLPRSFRALGLSYLRFDFRPGKALAYFQRALPSLQKDLVGDHPVIGLHFVGLAASYLALSQPEKSKPYLEQSLTIAERQYQPDHVALAIGLLRVADLYVEQGNYPQAASVTQRALAILQRMLDPEHPEVVRAQNSYTRVLRAAGAPWEPAQWERMSLAARHARERGDKGEAEQYCVQALQYVGVSTVNHLYEYAALLKTLGREEAPAAQSRADKLREVRSQRGGGYLGFVPSRELNRYADLLQELGRNAEAQSMRALATAEDRANRIHFNRTQEQARGGDPRGMC